MREKSRVYKYERLAPHALATAIQGCGLSADRFAYLIGVSEHKLGRWLSGAEAVPHWVRLILDLFELFPDSVRLAERLAAECAYTQDGFRLYAPCEPEFISRTIDELGISASQFARLTGARRDNVLAWLSGENDAPHWPLFVLQALVTIPGAYAKARKLADACVLNDVSRYVAEKIAAQSAKPLPDESGSGPE